MDADYIKGKNDNELELIKNFITKIDNGTINNKNKEENEFKKLKQKVTNDTLRQELIKNLERDLFGKEYEESTAERVKTEDKIHRELLLHQAHLKKIILQKLMNI